MAEQARRARVNDMNETGGSQHGVLVWLWGMVNTAVALCTGQSSRRQAAFEALVASWAGIVVSEGYPVYQHWVHGRQTCLAHLIRRARGLAARQEPELARCGCRVLAAWPRLGPGAQAPPTAGAVQAW